MASAKIAHSKILFMISAALAAFAATPAFAGDVSGEVTDNNQVRSLEGAEVEIVELQRRTQAGADGAFRFSNVPAGSYTLTVRYFSAEPFSQTITVPETGEVRVAVALAAASASEEVLVIGQRASLAGAISRQRASDTVDSILTRDGIGQFPDQNVAESVRRLPGINVLNDQGEGRFVGVRGLHPDLNAASVNGVRLTAPEAGVRSVALDVIPSDLIESIDVRKTLTPDMDADSLGGSIEISTTRGFDRVEPLFTVRAEGSYNDLNGDWSPAYSADFARRFGNLGVAGGVSYRKRSFSTDNIEMDGWDEDGGTAFADTVEYRDYDVERTRFGASLSLDYRLGNHTTLFTRALHSVFEDQEYRGRVIFEMDEDPSSGSASGASFLSDDGEIVVIRDMKDRYEEQTITSLLFGGLTNAGPWRFRYEASWTYAEEQERGSLDPIAFERAFEDPGEFGVAFDYSDWRHPRFNVLAGLSDFLDPTEYEFDEVERTTVSDSQDEEFAYRFDVTRSFALDRGTFDLQAGLRQRFRDKTMNADIDVFDYDGALDLTLADFLGQPTYGLADLAPLPSRTAFRGFFNDNLGDFEADPIDSTIDSLVEDYTVEEDIGAAYLMGRYDRGQVRIVGGLRVEKTEHELRGNFVEFVESGDTPVSSGAPVVDDSGDRVYVTPQRFTRDYTHWLPSVNLRYEPVEDIVLRLGAYRSVLRPGPEQMAPHFALEDGEAEFGNPDLRPYTAWNYDATAEWYFGRNAVLQAGLFYKQIDNPIFEVAINSAGVAPNGVAYDEAGTWLNGVDADVFGFEVGYAQAFDFLPGVLGGLVVSANYTYTDTEANALGRSFPLPGAAENTLNVVLGYDRGPLDIRFSIAYRDSYLDEVNTDGPDADRYVEDHIQYDLTAKFDVNDRFQIYGEFVNLGDEPYVAYQRGPAGAPRLLQYEEYSWTGKLGVRARF